MRKTQFILLLQKTWPLLFLIGLWFIFSSPYFLKGLVPYPSKYQVTFFAPWSHYEQWWGPVKNNAMPDVIDQIYPWKHFTIEWLKKGQIPFWNPFNFAGNPHMANFQSAVFSPFNLIYFFIPFVDAWSMIILLQPLLAALFTYLFVRSLKVSKIGSLISSITFMFCGFMVVWMAYGTLAMAILFLPLILFGIEKGFNEKSIKYFSLISVGLAASFFSGHVQTSLYLSGYSLLYVLFKSFTTQNKKLFLFASLAYIIGIGISLIQIFPTLSLYKESIRSGIAQVGGGIPLRYLPTIFSPDFYGNPVTRNDWYGTYAEWSSFIGIIPLVLGLMALLKIKNKSVMFFVGMSCISLLFSMDTPLQNLLLATHIPVLSTSIPSRIIVLFSFSFAILAAYGFDLFIEFLTKEKYKKVFTPIIISFFILASTFLSLKLLHPFAQDKIQIAQKNLYLPTLLFVLFTIAVCLQFVFRKKIILTILPFVILALVSFDSLRFAGKWMPFDPRNLVFPDVPVIASLQKNIGNGRVYGNLGTEVTSYYGISSLEGYDPLYIQRYGEFIQYAAQGQWQNAQRSVVLLDKRGKYTDRVLDLLGVNLVFQPIADTNQDWAYPVWDKGSKYSVLYHDNRFQLFKNNTAFPRAKLFYSYDVISDKQKILQRFYNEKFDFRNQLILEEKPTLKKESISENKNNVAIIKLYTPNEIVIQVETIKPGLLFLSDTYYGNWRVKVNGKDQKIYRADYAFRAVEVPEGRSTVIFYFQAYL